MHALETNIGIVLLEREVHRAVEPDVRSLDRVHVFTSHLELSEVEIFGEYLHLGNKLIYKLLLFS